MDASIPPSTELAPVEGAAARVSACREYIRALRGWSRAGVACLAGLLSVLAMAPFFAWPVLFATLPVLVWLIEPETVEAQLSRANAWRAFKGGWWFGFGYFFAGLFWIGEAFLVDAGTFGWLLPFAVTLLPAGLALFYGAAAAVSRAIWRPGLSGLLLMAVAFASAEWLRGHILTGFPWNVLGYALTQPLAMMQSASVLGIYGLTLWVVLIFTAPLCLLCAGRNAGTGVIVAGVPLLAMTLFGLVQVSGAASSTIDGVRVRIVQPSVPQREKWLPEKQGEIFKLHLDLSRQDSKGAVDNLSGISHVIWPEAAMPFRPLEHPEALNAIGELLPAGVHLFSGGLRVDNRPVASGSSSSLRAFNSLMVFGDGGQLSAVYDKIHLVPFGEYLPLQPFMEAIGFQQLTRQRGGFSTGVVPRPIISVANLPPVSALICYEAIFPSAVVQGSERPGLMISVTNDGWFGNTTGPRQHLHQARVRAVEEGVPLLRAANNGISAVIDSRGRLLQSMGMNERGVIDSPVPAKGPSTLYSQFGDAIFLLNLIVFLIAAAGLTASAPFRTQKRPSTSKA